MNVREHLKTENAVQCRSCSLGSAVLTHWRCYIGESRWSDGHPRTFVVFECSRCLAVRYFDLDMDLPETALSSSPFPNLCSRVPWCLLAPGHMGPCRGIGSGDT